MIISELDLSLRTLRAEFRRHSQQAAQTLCERLRKGEKGTLSPESMMMIFGCESALASGHGFRAITSQTVRERGNAAAHQLDDDDVLLAVLQGDLSSRQRDSLTEIYTLVIGQPPTFTV